MKKYLETVTVEIYELSKNEHADLVKLLDEVSTFLTNRAVDLSCSEALSVEQFHKLNLKVEKVLEKLENPESEEERMSF